MENFFIRSKTQLNFSGHFLYDNSATVEESGSLSKKILQFDGHTLEIQFNPVYLKNLSFDIFLISDNQELFRINKYKRETECIGMITEKIISIDCSGDKIAILTESEILLFDGYFDLEKSIELTNLQINPCENSKIRFGDEVMAVISSDMTVILDFNMKITGKISKSIQDGIFIKRYNKFAFSCIDSKRIEFIEPNGLEHGDPLDVFGDLRLMTVDNSEILLVITEDEIYGYFMKNFYWYKKFTVKGKFYNIQDNSILIKEDDSLMSYKIYRELTKGLVIDGNKLYYTDFNSAIIPPPFYYKKIETELQIVDFIFESGILYILDRRSLYKFQIVDQNISLISRTEIENFSGTKLFGEVEWATMTVIKNSIFILFNGRNVVMDSSYFNNSSNESGVILPFDISESTCNLTIKTNAILKIYNYNDNIGILYSSGLFRIYSFDCLETNSIDCKILNSLQFDFDCKTGFDIQFGVNGQIYFLNNGNLSWNLGFEADRQASNNGDKSTLLNTATAILSNIEERISKISLKDSISGVSSFLIYERYLLYILKNVFTIVDINDKGLIPIYESYAEDNLEILTVKDNSVIFYTRFGTLETVTNRLFSLFVVTNLINQRDIRLAAEYCDKYHIDYSIFLQNGFEIENLKYLSDSQALSLLNSFKFPNSRFILDFEYFDRLVENFDPDFVLRDKPFEVNEDSFIHLNIINDLKERLPYKSIDDKNIKNGEFLTRLVHKNQSNCLSNDLPFTEMINNFINSLSIDSHFSTIVNTFILLNRIELSFYLPNIQKVVKILLTKLSPETICKASMRTFDLDKIVEIHKICQKDYASFVSFYNSSQNVKFSVFDYLEDRSSALFYKIFTDEDTESIVTYAHKYNLIDQLLMYTYHNITDVNFYVKILEYKKPLEKFYLYKISNRITDAIEIARNNLFWREGIELDSSEENCRNMVDVLIENEKYKEAGEIQEKYLKEYSSAIKNYLKDREILKAYQVYVTFTDNNNSSNNSSSSNNVMINSNNNSNNNDNVMINSTNNSNSNNVYALANLIKNAALSFAKSDSFYLNDLLESYKKYKDRLDAVRARLNENMQGTQTTFSYSTMKSSKRALIKDRPGGVFENEYVLNKIKGIVDEIVELRRKVDELEVVLRDEIVNSQQESISGLLRQFESIKGTLKKEIEEMWDYKRTDIDFELPNVSKPVFSDYFE